MAGIDNIQSEILQEAQAAADALIEDARADAKKLAAESAEELDAIRRLAEGDCERIRAAGQVRLASRQEMLRRQEILRRKQDAVSGLIAEAYDQLANEDQEPYWQMVLSLLDTHIRPEKGRICFSQRDLDRMPKEVRTSIEKRAGEAGADLTIAADASVANGFILDFGGIDENCTLKAIFAERYEQMQDAVSAILWQE